MSQPPVLRRAVPLPAEPCSGPAADTPGPRRRLAAPRPLLMALALLAVLASLGAAGAQSFSADLYYQQCLRFEAGGDLETARQACLNALQIDPTMVDANLALGRIELNLGLYGSAEQRLHQIVDKTASAEPLVLLAQAAVHDGNFLEAESDVQQARSRLEKQPNRQLAAKTDYIDGLLNERRGLYNEALTQYNGAIDQDGLNVDYRLADSSLRF
ncbi:MAG TPA: tetratricopeptide repeat protein, partial [Trueperaceae bacterium]|nr:tetratricopeptide repeat protein [Trueperaceae bacterium]